VRVEGKSEDRPEDVLKGRPEEKEEEDTAVDDEAEDEEEAGSNTGMVTRNMLRLA